MTDRRRSDADGHCGKCTAKERILRAALKDIAEYRGVGPLTTPWRDIVRDIHEIAVIALRSSR